LPVFFDGYAVLETTTASIVKKPSDGKIYFHSAESQARLFEILCRIGSRYLPPDYFPHAAHVSLNGTIYVSPRALLRDAEETSGYDASSQCRVPYVYIEVVSALYYSAGADIFNHNPYFNRTAVPDSSEKSLRKRGKVNVFYPQTEKR